MFGDEIPTNANKDIEIIQKLNQLSNAELLTFLQSTNDKHLQKIANNLYRNRFTFQSNQNSTQDIVNSYLNW
jgi:hypothetical protein